MEIKFKSLQQFRSFHYVIAECEWDDKVTIDQRSDSGTIILANRRHEWEVDPNGSVVRK